MLIGVELGVIGKGRQRNWPRAVARAGPAAEFEFLAFTLRGSVLRAISLRRAHHKEFRRYVP